MRIQKRHFDLPHCLSGAALLCVCILLQPGLSSRAEASVVEKAHAHAYAHAKDLASLRVHAYSDVKHFLLHELGSIAFAVSQWRAPVPVKKIMSGAYAEHRLKRARAARRSEAYEAYRVLKTRRLPAAPVQASLLQTSLQDKQEHALAAQASTITTSANITGVTGEIPAQIRTQNKRPIPPVQVIKDVRSDGTSRPEATSGAPGGPGVPGGASVPGNKAKKAAPAEGATSRSTPHSTSGSDTGPGTGPGTGRTGDDPVMADEAAFLVESALQDFIVNVGDRVFFETDSAVLTSHAVAIIRSQVSWLQKNPDITVTVEGHADELGTKEYNIKLGVRRAKAVKTVLVKAGVAPERVRILSFGKERPVALCKNPPCGAQNRRVITRLNGRLNSQLGETVLPGNKPDLFEKGVPNTQDFPSSVPQKRDESKKTGGKNPK